MEDMKFQRDLIWMKRIINLGIAKRKSNSICNILKDKFQIDNYYLHVENRKCLKREINPFYIGALISKYKRGFFDEHIKNKKS